MVNFVGYIGGKANIIDLINSILPKNRCFVDVFGGGGSVMLGKKGVSYVEVYNDVNGELVNLFRVVKEKPDEFIRRGDFELYSREVFRDYQREYNNGVHQKYNDVERAFRYWYLIINSISSIPNSSWRGSVDKNLAVAMFNKLGDVRDVAMRLRNVIIDNRDFEHIIGLYDSEDTVFFLDPPYIDVDVDELYFRNVKSRGFKFDVHDHFRLYKKLKVTKGKFMMTIDNSKWIRDRYCGGCMDKEGECIVEGFGEKIRWFEYEMTYSSSEAEGMDRGKVTELMIMNYNYKNKDTLVSSGYGKLLI